MLSCNGGPAGDGTSNSSHICVEPQDLESLQTVLGGRTRCTSSSTNMSQYDMSILNENVCHDLGQLQEARFF